MLKSKYQYLRTAVITLLLALIASCNPYEPYSHTHYYIQATIDPEQANISANVQIVFIPRLEYHDSICFSLNSCLEIHSLTAQELRYYKFNDNDSGNLVLYIQEPIYPSEQLHIALSYTGKLDNKPVHKLDSGMLWYPMNPDATPATFQAKFAIPGDWQISSPQTGMGKHGKWLYQNEQPRSSINLIFTGR